MHLKSQEEGRNKSVSVDVDDDHDNDDDGVAWNGDVDDDGRGGGNCYSNIHVDEQITLFCLVKEAEVKIRRKQ